VCIINGELKSRLRLVVLVVVVALPVTLLLAWLYGGAVRDLVVMPFLYVAWIARIYARSVPRPLFWGGLLLFGAVLAVVNVLMGLRARRREEEAALNAELNPGYPNQVRQLTSQIRYARRSLYFRRALAKRLGRLILDSRDYAEQYAPVELDSSLDALAAPPGVREFFRDADELILASRRAGLLTWIRQRMGRRDEAGAPPADLEEVVQFLEDRLEVS